MSNENKIINKIFPDIPNKNDLKYDNIGLYSITLPKEADKISQIILEQNNSNSIIFDANAGLGGNTISFCKFFYNVIACEYDSNRFELLKNNMQVFNFDNIQLIQGNCLDFLNNQLYIYFFDPPWGGPTYKHSKKKITIKLNDFNIKDIINKIRENNTNPIYFKLPYNYDINELFDFNYDIVKIKNYLLIIIL